MIYTSILAASLSVTLTVAQNVFIPKNDWSKPCFNGVCTWDQPVQTDGKNAGSSGSMKIWGSPDAISDVTEAAGWMILDCDKNKMAQDIRLVCKSNNSTGAGCGHLSQNMSPEDKIVRLPDSCGQMPFARVAKYWTPQDQSIPQEAMNKIVRRDGVPPQVQAMSIDTDFASGNVTKVGNVSLAVQGANFPGNPAGSVSATGGPQRRSRLARRGFGDFVGNAISDIGNAATTVANTVQSGVSTVVNGAEQAANTVKNATETAVNDVKNATTINENVNKTLAPIDVNKDFPIFSGTVHCSDFTASLNADMNTKAHAVVTLGIAATGTIVPPKFDAFSVFAGLDANFNGALHITAQSSGQVSSGQQTLFEVGVPGLDFPGILTLGPTFQINGDVTASLDIDFDMTVDLAYNVKGAQLFFPPNSSKQKSGGNFQPADSNLTLSATPSVAANGTLDGHLIPTINLGINALSGAAQASVFLDLDASSTLNLQLNAGANITKETGKNATVQDAGVNGCVDVSAALNVNAGATGSLFDIFNAQTTANLFSKNFDLFQKCFNQGATPNTTSSAGTVDDGASAVNQTSEANATETASAANKTATSTRTSTQSTETSKETSTDSKAGSTKTSAAHVATSTPVKTSPKTKGSKLTKRTIGCGTFTNGLSLTSIVQELVSAANIKAV